MAMATDVSSVARLLRGEAGKRGGAGETAPEVVTMDLLGGCGGGSGGEDEVVDLEMKVPAGWERRLDLASGKTFLTPRRHGGHQDLNLPPPPALGASTSAAVCTLEMVRSALERAAAGRAAAAAASSPATSSSSSASTSSSSSSAGKRHRSPPASPSMRATACPSCLTYVLIDEADPTCPRCSAHVPPPGGKPPRDGGAAEGGSGSGNAGKKPKIDLNAAADESE